MDMEQPPPQPQVMTAEERDAAIRRVAEQRLATLEEQVAEFTQAWRDGMRRIDERFASGTRRMDDMQAELTRNTEVTTEVRDLMTVARGGFRVLELIGTGGMWLLKLGAAVGAAWAAWKGYDSGAAK